MIFTFPVYLLAGVAPLMAKGTLRPSLVGAMIEPLEAGRPPGLRAVATDGHIGGVAYSTVGAVASEGAGRLVLPAALVTSIVRQSRSGSSVTVTVEGGMIRASFEPRDRMSGEEYGRVMTGRFPEVEKVLTPRLGPADRSAAFNPELIGKIAESAKAAKRAGGVAKGGASMLFDSNGLWGSPFRLGNLVEGFSLGGVVMPLREERHRGDTLVELWGPTE